MLLLLPLELVTFHLYLRKSGRSFLPKTDALVNARVLASCLGLLRTNEQSPHMSKLVVATDAGSKVVLKAMGKVQWSMGAVESSALSVS